MINAKTTISISEARKHIFEIAEEVQVPHKVYTLTADGVPKAVIISAEEYESWTETMEVLRDCPDIFDRIAESVRAVKTGDWSNFVTLEELRKDLGIVDMVAEKPNKKYGIQNKNRKKSKKANS
ncbi:type II toxin-antitoxin system Phd/YefM family antitoxin [Candidatus Nomurabacteria bacterium]|nr:type II toxin-antitoxin system Phd/YefM family antitoxin [Candidatus Nomurabacteria bacterium]